MDYIIVSKILFLVFKTILKINHKEVCEFKALGRTEKDAFLGTFPLTMICSSDILFDLLNNNNNNNDNSDNQVHLKKPKHFCSENN